MSLLLIPTSNVDLHNRPPQQNTKNQPPLPSPCVTSSSPLAVSLPHVAPTLFVCSSICLFVCLVVASSLCPLSLLLVPLCCHAMSLCCVASLVIPLVSLTSRRRVVVSSRCCVVASRLTLSFYHPPLTHLVMPTLFDCCVVVLHLVVMACSVLLSILYHCRCRVIA